MQSRLNRLAERVARWLRPGDEPTEHPEDSPTDRGPNPIGCDPSQLQLPADVLTELGLTPEEFVVRVIEAEGGSVKQQAFTEYTDWSESTICRTLTEFEEDGHIVRIRMGRENIVYLPEEAPESRPTPTVGRPSFGTGRT